MTNRQDDLNILRVLSKKSKHSQRNLANELGFSLGKLNYCLKALKEKGMVKINNFSNSKKKLNYIYILTPKGIQEKTRLTINFMKQKMNEYEDLKKELNKTKKNENIERQDNDHAQ